MFLIIAYFGEDGEVVDQADTAEEAENLIHEYSLAFGPGTRVEAIRGFAS